MVNRNSGSKILGIAGRMIPAVCAPAALGLLLGGCSTYTPPPGLAAVEKTELNFSLDKCEPLDGGLYKCPAVDKAICNPYYNGQLDCVRVGKKGNVFVEKGIAMD